MELKDLKRINNGAMPQLEQSLLSKMIPAGIALGTTTGLSTLTDRKAIHNLPKFEGGKPGPILITGLGGGTTKNFNFAGRTSAAAQLGKGLTPDASKAIKSLPTGPSGGGGSGGGLGKAIGGLGDVAESAFSNLAGAIDFAGGIINAGQYNTTANDLLRDAGTSEGSIGGISYTRQNDVNAAQISALTGAENTANTVGLMGKGTSLGASVGSVAGPVGGLIGGAVGAIGGLVGGLLGGGARKRKMRRMIAEAKDIAFRLNDFSRSGALTSALQQQYAQQYGDTESQSLYGFKNGRVPGFTNGFAPNCRLSNGEHVILQDNMGNPTADIRVGVGRDNKDSLYAHVPNLKNAWVIPNNGGATEYLEETGDIQGAKYLTVMNLQKKNKYKNGMLPGFDGGKWGVPEWSNFMGNIVPLISTGVQYFKNLAQPTGRYTATHSNPNAGISRDMMLQRLYNPYSAYNDMWNMYAKTSYATNNTGGLSSSQRNLLRTTNYANTLDQIAKINNYTLEVNNRLLDENAQFIDKQGQFDAQLELADDIKKYDTHVRSLGSKYTTSDSLLARGMNFYQNMYKGFNDLYWLNYMRSLWDDDRDNENEDRKNKYGSPKTYSWDDVYRDMNINKASDFADTTSAAAWAKTFANRFTPKHMSLDEIYRRNIKNLGLTSMFFNPASIMPESFINPTKVSTKKRKTSKKK